MDDPETTGIAPTGQEPLSGDPQRQASASIRGYLYQIWISVHAWLELRHDEMLWLEGAEDIDRLYPGGAETVQVKAQVAPVTLRSTAVVKAIGSYWRLRAAHPEIKIKFRFLTTAEATTERGAPFGKGVHGLDVWERARRNADQSAQLIDFLQKHDSLPEDLRKFIKASDPSDVQNYLINPITWKLGARDAASVEAEVERKLVALGSNFGILPDDSKHVVDALLKFAFTNASSDSRKPLTHQDLHEIFQDVTTKRVPCQELAWLRMDRLQQQITQNMATTAPGGAVPVHVATRIQQTIPAMPTFLHDRKSLVDSCGRDLKNTGFMVLTGSVGMGKTTLAKLIAGSDGQWAWVHLAALRPEVVLDVLHHLGRLIDDDTTVRNLLIDDIDLTPAACRLYEQALAGILVTASSRSERVIITSQRSPSTRFRSALAMQPESIIRVPGLTEDEISALLRTAGFPRSDEECLRLAKIVSLQTSGHPQLVQAAVRAQLAYGWPDTKLEAILETPVEIVQEKRDARQILADSLSCDQRILAYWLGIAGMFRHDHAVAIGARAKVATPGDQVDALLGPWVEPIGDNYFRVTPLIGAAANDAFDEHQLRDIHASLAEAFLCCGHISQWEASAILMHAFAGRHAKILYMSATQMTMQADPQTRDVLYKELSWMLTLTTERGHRIFPENPSVNAALRMLQFKIAIVVDPSKAGLIASRWEEEIVECEDRQHYLLQRIMYVFHMLLYYQAPISPSRLIECFKELESLRAECPDLEEQMDALRGRPALDAFNPKGADAMALFFSFAAARCDGPMFLLEILEGLGQLPNELRSRMLSAPIGLASPSTMLVNRAWLAVADQESPDWPSCAAALKTAQMRATAMGLKSIAHAAARATAVVYDEYMGDQGAAIEAVEEAKAELGTSAVLEDQSATILYHKKEYGAALRIWQELLARFEDTDEDGDIAISTIRKAAISAAMSCKWALAADLFSKGAERGRTTEVDWIPAGFMADAGFAHWKAGQYPQMLAALSRSLATLENLPDPSCTFTTFVLGKTIGGVLVWIENQFRDNPDPDTYEPHPGMCSDPEMNERLRHLPVTPTEHCWVILADIELKLHLGDAVYRQVSPRFDDSECAVSLVLLRQIQLSYAASLRNYTATLARSFLMTRTLTTLSAKGGGRGLMEVRIESADLSAPVNEDEANFIMGVMSSLLVAAMVHGELGKIFDEWGPPIAEDGRFKPLQPRFQCAQDILQTDLDTACSRMRERDAGWFTRTLSALRLALDADTSPEDMYQAHAFLLVALRNTTIKHDVAGSLATLIEQNWRHLIQYPVLLQTPMTTVPSIRAACDLDAGSVRKLSSILLAAVPAIRMPVPARVIRDLETLRDNSRL